MLTAPVRAYLVSGRIQPPYAATAARTEVRSMLDNHR